MFLLIVRIGETYNEDPTSMMNHDLANRRAAHFTNNATLDIFLNFDREGALPQTLRLLFKGNDGQCYIPLVSWSNYQLIIMKNKNGVTQFVEKDKFGNAEVWKKKFHFGVKPELKTMCTSEWKWFTFDIRQKNLSFTIHHRDNTLLLSWSREISEDLIYTPARNNPGDPGQASAKNKTPFEFNELSGTVGQIQYWSNIHDNIKIHEAATLTINKEVIDRGEGVELEVDYDEQDDILQYQDLMLYLRKFIIEVA